MGCANPIPVAAARRLVTQGRILVIRGGAIGDFILTLPVLSALRRQFPQCHLEVLGYPHIAGLALAGGLVDATRSIEARAMAGFFARNGPLDSALATYFDDFALIISFLYDPDGIFAENLSRTSSAQLIAGPHRPDDSGKLHATEVFLSALQRLAIFDADPIPHLNITDQSVHASGNEAVSWVAQKSTLAFHPGSGSERKNWPETKWTQLLEAVLQVPKIQLLLVGGEAEGNRLERMAQDLASDRVLLLQNRPLPVVAAVLESCHGFVGHDSGIAHLAAALGLPGIVLWGPSVEEVWRPRSARMIILRDSAGIANLSVSEVISQIRATLLTGN